MVWVVFGSVRQLCRELLWTGSPVVLKLGSLCGSTPYIVLVTKEKLCENPFESKPLHVLNLACRKVTPALSLTNPMHVLITPPPWVWLDLLSTYVLTLVDLTFFRGSSRSYSRGHWVGGHLRTQPCLWYRVSTGSFHGARLWCFLRCRRCVSVACSSYVSPCDSGVSRPTTSSVCPVMNHLL